MGHLTVFEAVRACEDETTPSSGWTSPESGEEAGQSRGARWRPPRTCLLLSSAP